MNKKLMMALLLGVTSFLSGCSGERNNVVPVVDYNGMTIARWSNYTDIGIGVEQLSNNHTYYNIEELTQNTNIDVLPFLIGILPDGRAEKVLFDPDIQQTMYLTQICSLDHYVFIEFSNHPEVGNYSTTGSSIFQNNNLDSIIRKSYLIEKQSGKLYLLSQISRFIISNGLGNDSLQAGDYVYVRGRAEEYSPEEIFRIGVIAGKLEVVKVDQEKYYNSYFVDKYNNLYIDNMDNQEMYLISFNGEIKTIEEDCYRWINGLVYQSDGRHYNEYGNLVDSNYIPNENDAKLIYALSSQERILRKNNVDYYYYLRQILKVTWANEEECTIEITIPDRYNYEYTVLGERIYYVPGCGCQLYWIDILTGETEDIITPFAIYDIVSTGKVILFSGMYKGKALEEGILFADDSYGVSGGPAGLQIVYVWPMSS